MSGCFLGVQNYNKFLIYSSNPIIIFVWGIKMNPKAMLKKSIGLMANGLM